MVKQLLVAFHFPVPKRLHLSWCKKHLLSSNLCTCNVHTPHDCLSDMDRSSISTIHICHETTQKELWTPNKWNLCELQVAFILCESWSISLKRMSKTWAFSWYSVSFWLEDAQYWGWVWQERHRLCVQERNCKEWSPATYHWQLLLILQMDLDQLQYLLHLQKKLW